MAATRKKRTAPAAAGSTDVKAALTRAEEAEAKVEELLAKLAAKDDDDDDDDDDDGEKGPRVVAASYNPATHIAISLEDHHLLLVHKAETDKKSSEFLAGLRQHSETLFSGFAGMADISKAQREADLVYANQQRQLADEYARKLADKEMEISRMVRQSEDARLERERLAADIARVNAANEQLQMSLESKERMRQLELNAMRDMAAPTFKALTGYLQKALGGGLAGMLPPAVADAAAAAPGSPHAQLRLSLADTDTWNRAFLDVYSTLQPPALGHLRALACSYLLRNHGAPPVPPEVANNVIALVFQDAGEDKVMALLNASGAAYVAEATASAPSAAQPPN